MTTQTNNLISESSITTVNELLDEITHGITITPNARLAKTLHEMFNAKQSDFVWETPKIYSIQVWLELLWAEFGIKEQPALLSPISEAALWLKVVEELSPYAFSKTQLAKALQAAWTHCHQFCLDIHFNDFQYNDETRFFYECQKLFVKLTKGYQPFSTLANKLITLINRRTIIHFQQLRLAYFDEIPPIYLELFNALEKQGVTIKRFDGINAQKNISYAEFSNEYDEYSALIQWLNTQRAEDIDRIGIVVPNLSSNRQLIARRLSQHISLKDINFSQGLALSEYGLINSFLHLFSLKKQKLLTIEDCHFLLSNPFFFKDAMSDETIGGIVNNIEKTGERLVSINHFLKQVENTSIQNNLKHYFFKFETEQSRTLDDWSDIFAHILMLFEIPGHANITSEEYQALNKFYETLSQLALLETNEKKISFNEAYDQLVWLCRETTFQPQAQNEPIQVLGFLEALGQNFNALWVMDMTAETLPQRANPSPFIPLYLQQKYNMPHATEERELVFAEKVLDRLKGSAPVVIFSYARHKNDEVTLKSPLLVKVKQASLPIIEDKYLFDVDYYTPSYHISCSKESVLKGGSFIIKEQARCPFRAYALFRLNIKEEKERQDGLDELDRGTLVHLVLECFWTKIKDQKTLLSFSLDALQQEIELAVINAINQFKKKRPLTMNQAFCSREQERLTKLLEQFIELEKKRPAFTVTSIEKQQSLTLNQHYLNLRVDRIDTLNSGEQIVIDYKTGSPSINAWFNTPVEEPQLPLYSLINDHIKALMYVILKPHKVQYKGVSDTKEAQESIKNFDEVTENGFIETKEVWRKQFTALLDDFSSGNIEATPYKDSLCQTCHVKGLCGKLFA